MAKAAAVKFDAQQKLDPETKASNEGRKLTVDAMMATWLATKTGARGLKTLDNYRTDAREVLLTFSGRLATSLKPSEVDVWTQRDRGHSLKARSLRALRQGYQLAIRDQVLTSDPTAGIKSPIAPHREIRFLSWSELERLAGAANDDPLIWLLGTAGLRLGEAAGLKVGDVSGGRLRISRQVTVTSEGLREGPPKHGKSRDVPVPAFVLEKLPTADRASGEWMFPNGNGGPFDQHNWRARVFRPAVERAGLQGLTPHLLRHSAVSLAIRSGADVKYVQRMVGHSTLALMDLYGHLFEDHLDEVSLKMQASWQAASA